MTDFFTCRKWACPLSGSQMTPQPWPSQEAGAILNTPGLIPTPWVPAEPHHILQSGQCAKLLRSRTCLCPPRDSTESTVVPALLSPVPTTSLQRHLRARIGQGWVGLLVLIPHPHRQWPATGPTQAPHSWCVGFHRPLVSGLCLWLLFYYENYSF